MVNMCLTNQKGPL